METNDVVSIQDVLGGSSKPVVTVMPDETIADAVDLLNDNKIGAVVVTPDKATIVGILSERDVVRHLAREQEGTLRLRVEDLMTENVQVCQLSDDIESTMGTMVAGRFRHMPVVTAENTLCGMVSLGDLVFARLSELEKQNLELRRGKEG
jgi:CBS domain-containing protein